MTSANIGYIIIIIIIIIITIIADTFMENSVDQ